MLTQRDANMQLRERKIEPMPMETDSATSDQSIKTVNTEQFFTLPSSQLSEYIQVQCKQSGIRPLYEVSEVQ